MFALQPLEKNHFPQSTARRFATTFALQIIVQDKIRSCSTSFYCAARDCTSWTITNCYNCYALHSTTNVLEQARAYFLNMGTLSSTINREIEDGDSSAEENAPTAEDYVPTAEDVFNVRHGLLRKVPPELANDILEEGRYWPKATAVFRPHQDVAVSASDAPNINAARVLILTPTLADWIGIDMPVKMRELSIKIESHDQGWCGEDPNLPPYAASWTWFEAAIVRDSAYSNSNPETNSEIKRFLENTDRSTRSPSIQTARNPQSTYDPDVWVIQRNVRASKGHTTHDILWTAENVDDVETRESLDDTGAGRGAGFVSSLEMGDRLAIIARARFPGWVNTIKRIELQFRYSI
ncbi:unnamed protein product [Cyclocybe aegerita]|uniref:Uncharacterized protein n=1 Tax=Cyclocybe aegerita TaxID=1973307 RepID=A0A8S0WIK7_CYCAE|nr:unnamed protein product [Cyclocybe aegerita]